MPEARGLFKRVICESSFAMDLSLTSYQDSITISDEFFKRLHVKSVEEAERLEAKTLLRVQNEIIKHSMGGTPIFSGVNSKLFSPVIDNAVIPENYWDYFIQTGCCGIDFLGGQMRGNMTSSLKDLKNPVNGPKRNKCYWTIVKQNWIRYMEEGRILYLYMQKMKKWRGRISMHTEI